MAKLLLIALVLGCITAPAFAQSPTPEQAEQYRQGWLKVFREHPDIAAAVQQCSAAGKSLQECARMANEMFAAKERATAQWRATLLQFGLRLMQPRGPSPQQQQEADQAFRDMQLRDLEGRMQRLEQQPKPGGLIP